MWWYFDENGHTWRKHHEFGSPAQALSTIKCYNLKVEPLPHRFKLTWVNKTSLPVSHRCKVSIQIASYKDEIVCDVLPVDVTHILLGRPWLYDRNVTHHSRENTYIFRFLIRASLLPLVDLKSCFLPLDQSLHRPRPRPWLPTLYLQPRKPSLFFIISPSRD